MRPLCVCFGCRTSIFRAGEVESVDDGNRVYGASGWPWPQALFFCQEAVQIMTNA